MRAWMEGDKSTIIQKDASHNESRGSSTEDDACVICLEKISERAIAVPCRHQSFDFLCLISWLQERSSCPLCKIEVNSVRYDFKTLEGFKTFLVSSTSHSASGFTTPSVGTPQTFQRFHRPPAQRRPRANQAAQHQNLDIVLLRRRHIYRNQLYSLHVGSNRLSRFQDLTPELFRNDEELISRARKWIRRELQVFEFLNTGSNESQDSNRRASNAEFLLEYMIAILKTVDVKGSGGQAEDMLQEFLGRDHTKLFLHELRAWLRSPYNSLEDWDRAVQYRDALSKDRSRESNTQHPRSIAQHEPTLNRLRQTSRPQITGRTSGTNHHPPSSRRARKESRRRYIPD
ncbi:MAG: hypothetical protein M1836_000057 [Candelina mexicana]|nr:MAG: hypothetical protein M1836_000057 [Candelina mexicana]